MAASVERVAVVTGANRGVGFSAVQHLCRVFKGTVFLTSRSVDRGRSAQRRLNNLHCYPAFYLLHTSERDSVVAFAEFLRDKYGGLDVLVNNAGIKYLDYKEAFYRAARNTVHVNFFSTLFLCHMLFPLLRPHARVVNLSSPCGHLSYLPSAFLRQEFSRANLSLPQLINLVDVYKSAVKNGDPVQPDWGEDPYCTTKVAFAALTFVQQRAFAKERPLDDIVVNSYSPGDVRSRITGYVGSIKPNEAAANVVQLATLPHNVTSPVGQYVWHNLSVVDWTGERPGFPP